MNEDWSEQIQELYKFFKTATLPQTPYKFNDYMVIHDMKKFLNAHFMSLKHHNGVLAYKPCLLRLYKLKKQIENENRQLSLL